MSIARLTDKKDVVRGLPWYICIVRVYCHRGLDALVVDSLQIAILLKNDVTLCGLDGQMKTAFSGGRRN